LIRHPTTNSTSSTSIEFSTCLATILLSSSIRLRHRHRCLNRPKDPSTLRCVNRPQRSSTLRCVNCPQGLSTLRCVKRPKDPSTLRCVNRLQGLSAQRCLNRAQVAATLHLENRSHKSVLTGRLNLEASFSFEIFSYFCYWKHCHIKAGI